MKRGETNLGEQYIQLPHEVKSDIMVQVKAGAYAVAVVLSSEPLAL